MPCPSTACRTAPAGRPRQSKSCTGQTGTATRANRCLPLRETNNLTGTSYQASHLRCSMNQPLKAKITKPRSGGGPLLLPQSTPHAAPSIYFPSGAHTHGHHEARHQCRAFLSRFRWYQARRTLVISLSHPNVELSEHLPQSKECRSEREPVYIPFCPFVGHSGRPSLRRLHLSLYSASLRISKGLKLTFRNLSHSIPDNHFLILTIQDTVFRLSCSLRSLR